MALDVSFEGKPSQECAWCSISPKLARPPPFSPTARLTGLKWTPEESASFGGMPTTGPGRPHLLILRYGFYVSQYDAEQRVPLWLAHIDQSDAFDKARGRTKGAWCRKDDKFTPDTKIVCMPRPVSSRS